MPPSKSVPAVFAAVPGVHGMTPPVRHPSHSPHRGRNAVTTRSPTANPASDAAVPTASTMPAASWPSSIGTGRGRLPSTTDRSE